jgi:protein-S-isoprenylcysteine O-methyltransferase Ste14
VFNIFIKLAYYIHLDNGIINMSSSKLEDKNQEGPWTGLVLIIFENLFSLIRNPSFVIFSIIAISISTLGIWIDFFPAEAENTVASVTTANASEHLTVLQKINKLSVFTFCIATLGAMATDYVFEEKYLDKDRPSKRDLLTRHIGFLLWFICVVLSFFALRDACAIFPALIVTLILWMCVNIKTKKFQHINEEAKNNLAPDYGPSSQSDDFKGGGL